MQKIYANDLTQLLALIEEETVRERNLRNRLKKGIAAKHLRMPREILQEFIDISETLATPLNDNLGYMIVVTGVDKSGKETQAFNPEGDIRLTSIYDYLLSKSHRVLRISLPSYRNTFGSLIAAYLGKEDSGVKILGELPEEVAWILWSLDRAQHNLEAKDWLSKDPSNVVVSKRWTETNIVYQKAKGINTNRILMLERNIIKPTYTFVIDVPVETVFRRMHTSKEKPDKYENLELLAKVRKNYARLHKYYPFGKIFYFDGSRSPKRVNQKLLEKLNDLGF